MLVELDGLAFHSSPAERVRDGRRDRGSLREGWVSVRAYWSDVATTPCELAGEVGGILTSRGWDGRAQPCRRRSCALRTTLRTNG